MPEELITTETSEMTPVDTYGKDHTFIDPWCDPDCPRKIQFEDVTSAAFKIRSFIVNTPCTRSLIGGHGLELYCKKDYQQHTGSFKERGARYALMMMSEEQKRRGVISASAGNHALALCYHANQLGIPVTVVMPKVAPIMKVQSCRSMNAEVIVDGNDMGEAKQIAMRKAHENDMVYVNGYDHPHIMAGQGTIGLEIMEQVPDVDAVIIPIGGGGLIAGVATAVKGLNPNVKIIGVESERMPTFHASRNEGKLTKIQCNSTLADGLCVPLVGCNAFHTANHLIDDVILVEEDWIAIAILRLVEREKVVVEGAGAIGIAAVLAGHLRHLKGKKVVTLMCGGNIDTTILGRCLERGMAAEGRLMKFHVCVSDRPGGVADLAQRLSNIGVSIKDISHERAWLHNDVFSVSVMVVCETRNWQHSNELMDMLRAEYSHVSIAEVTHPPRQSTAASAENGYRIN